MIFIRTLSVMGQFARGFALMAMALVLTACMATDDTTGSRLTQPAPGGEPRKPTDADNIVIVGQEVAHAIMDLPAIANAATPPLVQFTGVTSIIKGRDSLPADVDTDPYTDLFRDRLLLLTREKLRFVERTLPQLVIAPPKKKKGKKAAPTPQPEVAANPDYQILAELRGRLKDDLYKIQVQFVDAHTGDVLFDGLYSIRKEISAEPPAETSPDTTAQSTDMTTPPPPDPNAPPAETGNGATQ